MARRTNIRRKIYAASPSKLINDRPTGGQNAGLDEFDLQAMRECSAMKRMPRKTRKSDL